MRHAIIWICGILLVLGASLLLDIQAKKNQKRIDTLNEEIDVLNHQVNLLRDSISILQSDMMAEKIDLGRYEVAIDYLEGDCKTKMDEILSHME